MPAESFQDWFRDFTSLLMRRKSAPPEQKPSYTAQVNQQCSRVVSNEIPLDTENWNNLTDGERKKLEKNCGITKPTEGVSV